jgi:glutathione S-transferase
MAEDLRLFDLHPSPNNMKARIALAYKGLSYDMIPVDPQDRGPVIEASGQPLTPVLMHGDLAVWDSGAILRHLDSAYPETPRLFSDDYAKIAEIEGWEMYGRSQVIEPIGMVIRQFFAGTEEAEVMERASKLLNVVTGRIEDQLNKTEWLAGDRMTAADITCAPCVWYGMVPEEGVEDNPIAPFFRKHLHLGEEREATRTWALKVMAYDK